MTPERWKVVDSVVQAALLLTPSERTQYLDRACGSDASLRQEAESLLAAAQSDEFLEHPAITPLGSTGQGEQDRADQPPPERLVAALSATYAVEREIGRGGMATVYLARDLRHHRSVAVKVLHSELSAVIGVDRFLKEIELTASLQHPHILPLFDSGNTDGLLYYVMPFVAGESLRARLARERQLPVDDALRIATEAASALEHAHRRGIVHRDVKPENILLADDGGALVADFGIALAASHAGGERLTQTGLSLGTPQYMSPEQATADKHITNRSDIYSLGSVLYEMLTGEPPHTGSSAQAVILKIVSDEVRPVRDLRKAVPPHVAAAVAKAVEKLPADRFDSARAFAEALNNPTFALSIATDRTAGPLFRRFAVPALTGVAIVTAALAAWGWLRPSRTTSVVRYPTSLAASGALDGLTFRVEAALSPDGASLVFRDPLRGPGQLYIKRRDEVIARPLAGTEGGSGPFFSPDGAWIGFVAHGQLRRVPSTGGVSIKLADSVDPTYNQGAWLENGSIFYYDLRTHTLRRLRSGEATSQVIASPATVGGRFPAFPSPLPSARGILFTAHLTNCVGPVSCRPHRVYVYDERTGAVRALFDDAIGAWYVRTGHVLYLTSSGTLMAVPWNNSALAATGPPVPILDGIQAPGFLISNEGTALYLLGSPEFAPGPKPNATVVWVDRSGHVEPVDSSWHVNTGGKYGGSDGSLETHWGLALSPDGQRIALTLLTDLGTDIWIKRLPSGPVSRLTLHPGDDGAPAWTPDGRAVTFLSDRSIPPDTTRRPDQYGLWQQPANGTGEARLVWGKGALIDGFLERRWPMDHARRKLAGGIGTGRHSRGAAGSG
jgi:serine/threonine-protein kinase